MSLLHYAGDAVHVLQDSPDQSDPLSTVVFVGISEKGFPNDTAHTARGQYIGLLQFPPLKLPANQNITSVRLCMLAYSSAPHTMRIGVYQNLALFDGRTVNYWTRPAVAPLPLAVLQVEPDGQSSYVTCDLRMLFKGRSGYLPGFGLSLRPIDQQRGMVAFYAQTETYLPYLEISLSSREEEKRPCGPEESFVENVFTERVFDLCGQEQVLYTPVLYTASAKVITFFVRNEGAYPLEFRLQISPNGREFLNDHQSFSLRAGEMKAATPYLFGKFMRVCLNPSQIGQGIAARIWCQAQTNNYMVKGDLQSLSSPPDNGTLAMSLSGAFPAKRRTERSTP